MPTQPIAGGTKQTPLNLEIDKFDGGVITLIDEGRLPTTAAKDARDMMQVADGRWAPRWGDAYYGPDLGAAPDGVVEAVKPDGTTELLVVAGGALKRVDPVSGTVTTITGATFTAGKKAGFHQNRSVIYIFNGVDPTARYNFTTLTPYVAIAAPGAVSGFTLAGLTAGSYKAYYQIVAYNDVGHTPAGPEAFTTTNKARTSWIAGTDRITFSWSAVTGATRYGIYYADTGGNEVYLADVPATVTSFTDDGSTTPNIYDETPVDNTTGGPLLTDLATSNNRTWGLGDPSYPNRIYFTGLGEPSVAFTIFTGGGYYELEPGGRDRPVKIVHFRDGKGGQLATIFCTNPEGLGSIHQISLQDTTVGQFTFSVPSSAKIQGFSGTPAAGSVVNVGDSVFYANRRGVFSLGSKPNLLNVLSTDELSANVRPFFRALQGKGLPNMVAYHYDAKVFFAVPFGGTANDRVVVFDTERRNWTLSWNVGVKQFLEYTDATGQTRLLSVPTTGSRMIEFGENITGHLGQPIQSVYLSGLYPVSRDRLDWARLEAAYIELSQPQGPVTFEVLGTEKRKGFNSVGSVTVPDTISSAGWGMERWSTQRWSRTSGIPRTFAQASVIRKLPLNRRLLKNVQFRITANSLNSKFTVLGIQLKGKLVRTKDPEDYTVRQ